MKELENKQADSLRAVESALQIATGALQDIACSSQTENLLWWQVRARGAQKLIAECFAVADEQVARDQSPSYGIIDPDYARIYTKARCLAWQEGYALAMHGSFTRDLDLIAVPWTEQACDPEKLAARIADACDLRINGAPGKKPHGRLAFTFLFNGFGDPRFVDLSVIARAATANKE